MAQPYKLFAFTAGGTARFTKSFSSLRKAARAAAGYAQTYGTATVTDARAGVARGTLVHCWGASKSHRNGSNRTKAFARCQVSSAGRKLLKRPRRRRR